MLCLLALGDFADFVGFAVLRFRLGVVISLIVALKFCLG